MGNDLTDAISGIGEAAKFAGAVYGDLAAPTAKEIGLTVGVGAAVFLKPARGLLLVIERMEDYVGAAVERRLDRRRVPAERRQPPDPQILVGAAMGLLGAGEKPELRDMFESLLATSMDSATAGFVHPSFPEIIRQLSPDEARILRACLPGEPIIMDVTTIVDRPSRTREITIGTSHHFPTGTIALHNESMTEVYLTNLERLSLVRATSPEPDRSGLSMNYPIGQRSVTKAMGVGSLALTTLGETFWKACGCGESIADDAANMTG